MKNYIIISLLLIFACDVCIAETNWSLKPMNISLPSDMRQAAKMESSPNVLLYIFVAKSVYNDLEFESHLQIESLDSAPPKETENEAWQTQILAKQITHWRESSPRLFLESQHPALFKKPKTENIGKYSYKTVEMSFDGQNAKFLNVIYNHATYMFTLVSIGKDEKLREKNMEKMIEQLKTVELKVIHK